MNKLTYEQWRAAYREMAVQYSTAEMAEMMIPMIEGEARARAAQARADAANGTPGTPDQLSPGIQAWRTTEHYMGGALVALQKMGYTIIPPIKFSPSSNERL